MDRLRTRARNEDGTALIVALMAVMLLTALGSAVIIVSNTETMIAHNYRVGKEALYAADAGVERVMQDLLMVPRWNDILTGELYSSFTDGEMTEVKTIQGGGTFRLCCGPGSATALLQAETDAANLWLDDNPRWRLYAWGPLSRIIPGQEVDSDMYLAVWVADDPADDDGNPLADTNGTLTLHAEAYGPFGARKVIEVTVARTSSTEIERGQIAQRGQEELNQRARKAAVQTPGRTLSRMRLNTGTGGMTVQ